MNRKKGLGKGLGALLSENIVSEPEEKNDNSILEVDINKIEPNKNQPRKNFDSEKLAELAESIREIGIDRKSVV